MSWREQLRDASFRGVPFQVEQHRGSVGRRNVVHEYPKRNVPFVEDMGRKTRAFSVEAFIIGANYMAGRDALISALEAEGPGLLVHPYLGELQVAVVGEATFVESTREGGMVTFSMPFTESGEQSFPSAAASTQSAVDQAADAAAAAGGQDFSERFAIVGYAEHVYGSAAALYGDVTSAIGDVQSTLNGAVEGVSEFVSDVEAFAAGVGSLLRYPVDLAQDVMGLIGDIGSLGDDPYVAYRNLTSFFGFGGAGSGYPQAAVPLTTPSRQQQTQNQAATIDLVQRTAVIEAARVTARMDFSRVITAAAAPRGRSSFDAAIAVRDEISAELEKHMEAAESHEVYIALQTLRATVVRDISARGANLARVVSYTPAITLPALVVAHRIYGDATRDQEIIDRNRIRHPGFVPGGRALSALTDE